MSYEFTRQKIEAEKKARIRKTQWIGLAVIVGIAVLALIYETLGLNALIGVTGIGVFLGAALIYVLD